MLHRRREFRDGELDGGDFHELDRCGGLLLGACRFVGAVDLGVGEEQRGTRVVVRIRESAVVEALKFARNFPRVVDGETAAEGFENFFFAERATVFRGGCFGEKTGDFGIEKREAAEIDLASERRATGQHSGWFRRERQLLGALFVDEDLASIVFGEIAEGASELMRPVGVLVRAEFRSPRVADRHLGGDDAGADAVESGAVFLEDVLRDFLFAELPVSLGVDREERAHVFLDGE